METFTAMGGFLLVIAAFLAGPFYVLLGAQAFLGFVYPLGFAGFALLAIGNIDRAASVEESSRGH